MGSEVLSALCAFAFILLFITVVGHGIWVFIAWIFRNLAGDTSPPLPRPGAAIGQPCPYCKHPSSVYQGRCIACGRVPQITPGTATSVSLEQDLEATARHLRRLLDRGVLPQEQFEILIRTIRSDQDRLKGLEPAPIPKLGERPQQPILAEVVTPSLAAPPIAAPAAATPPQIPPVARPPVAQPQLSQPAGASPFAPSAAITPAPVAPAVPHLKPAPPSRPLADMLQSFMEETNIRWGEIIAGLLIVFCAAGLIISLRNTLKGIPYFPAMLFMLFTVSFYGAGMYTLRRWNLHAISRVILIISLLLVPLSFSAAIVMSGSGDMQRPPTDPLFLAAVVIGTAVFGFVTFTASGELVREGKWWLSAAVLGTSLSQIVINRATGAEPKLGQISLLTALPLAAFLIAIAGQVLRGRTWKRLSLKRLNQTFLVLGIATFALIAPLSLLLHHSTERLTTLARMTPGLSFAAAAILAMGLLVHRRALAGALSPYRTAGTAVAIFGGLTMLGMVALAWPRPELLLWVGIVNFLLLATLAVAGNLSLLHGPAIACGSLACVIGFHMAQGRFSSAEAAGSEAVVTSQGIIQALLMGRTGVLLTVLGVAAGGAGWSLLQNKRREDGVTYLGGAAALGALSVLVALICGVAPLGTWGTIDLDADLAAPILLFYAVAIIAVSPFARVPGLVVGGSALLWLGLAEALHLNDTIRGWLEPAGILPLRPVFTATLIHSAASVLIAAIAARRILFVPAKEHQAQEQSPLWNTFTHPLALCGVASLVAATPFIILVNQERLLWHAGDAWWAAAIWLAVLLIVRHPAATYGMQAMVALGAGFIAAEVMRQNLVGPNWFVQVRHLHVQVIVVAAGAILFSVFRKLTQRFETIRSLTVTRWPAIDQLLMVLVVRLAAVLALFAAWEGLCTELSLSQLFPISELGLSRYFPADRLVPQMPIAASWTGWLIVSVVFAALLVSLWERITIYGLAGIAITLWAIPWLIAARFDDTHSVASAARWTTALFGLCGAAVFIFRTPLRAALKQFPQLQWGRLQKRAYYFTVWQPIVLGGVPVLLITIIAVLQEVTGHRLGGPLAGTLFDNMGLTVSYAVPLFIVVAMLLGYAIREQEPLFAFGGSAVWQFAINLAFMLHVVKGPKLSAVVHGVEWLQWNAIAAAVFGLTWAALRQWRFGGLAGLRATTARGLSELQLVVSGLLAAAIVFWALGKIVLHPGASPEELAWLGNGLSYVTAVLVTGLFGWHAWRREKQILGDMLPFAVLAVVVLAAASCDQSDQGADWVAYHVLAVGSLVLALLATIWSAAGQYIERAFGRRSPDLAQEGDPRRTTPLGRFMRSLTPSHWTCFVIAAFVSALSIRGAWWDPHAPWWSVGTMAGAGAVAVMLGLSRRAQPYAYLSVLAAVATVAIFWISLPKWMIPLERDFPEFAVLAACALAAIWLGVEIRSQRREDRPFDPRFFGPAAHHATLVVSLFGMGLWLIGLSAAAAIDDRAQLLWKFEVRDVATLVVLAVLAGMHLWSLWDRRAYVALSGMYALGLIVTLNGLRHANLYIVELFLASVVAAATYVALTGHVWSFGANLAVIGTKLGISDTVGGLKRTSYWLPAVNIAITAAVSIVGLIAVLSHDGLEWRVAAALCPGIAAWGIACLAQERRKEAASIAALLLAGLAAVFLGWAQIEPSLTAGTQLARVFRLLMVLSALTFLYGLVLPRYLFVEGTWNAATRKAGYTSGLLAIATFIAVLCLEVGLFKPGIGVPEADGIQVAAVAVVLVALIAGLFSLALLPGRDPLALSEEGRQFYIYGAQAVSALLFAHLYVCRPYWFDTVLKPYWPYLILGIAFGGVGVGELFRRTNIPVLAVPFRRMGVFLPLIPALAMLSVDVPAAPYQLILFLASLMYLVLCIVHRSWMYGAAAAVAGNLALWVLLDEQQLRFLDHPQVWLIPPALSVLIGAQLNRHRLSAEQLTGLRYASTIVIYLSSTSEIFIHAAEINLWPPMILAAISVAGALAGIVLRIRAFLYLGTAFTLMALVSMVWHAARAIDQTWPWWAFGFGTGIALLVLFAVFEKKKEEIKLLVARMRSWEQ